MSDSHLVERTFSHDEKAAHLTLNRPDKINAINPEMASELAAHIEELEHHDTTRVVTLRGAGGNFCAGVDAGGIHEFVKDSRMDDLRDAEEEIEESFETLSECDLPIIAVIEGYALAGGLEVVLNTDLAIAAADAQIGDQHINRNLIPGGGSSQRLPRRVGLQRAKELIFTGKRISGTEAAEWGLINEAVDPDELDSVADEWVDSIADKGRKTLQSAKYLIDKGQNTDLQTGLELEKFVSTTHFFTEEGKDGLRSFSDDE